MNPTEFLFDDAYITLTSALALRNGGDPHYPGTPALYGVTSPVHVVLVSLLCVVLPGPLALFASSLIGSALYLLAMLRLAGPLSLGRMDRWLLSGTAIGSGWLHYHLVNGLETSLAVGLFAWSIVAHAAGRRALVAALAGLLPFVRPEMVLWSAVLVGDVIWRRRADAVRVLAVTGAAAVPWVLLLAFLQGGIAPASLAAKRDWFVQGCLGWEQRARLAAEHLALWGMLAAGVLPGLWGLIRSATGRLVLAFGALLAIGWFVAAPGLLAGYQRYRYQSLLVAGMAVGIVWLPAAARRLALAWGTAVCIMFLAHAARTEPGLHRAIAADRTAVLGMLAKSNADRVLVHDAGYLSFAGGAPVLIDMVGLKTPDAARANARWTGPSCGAQRWRAIAATAARQRAEHLVIWRSWDDVYGVTEGLVHAGWRVTLLDRTPGNVELYRLHPPKHSGS